MPALLRALPYPDPARLVAVRDLQGADEVPASYPEYLDWKDQPGVFTDAGAYFTTTIALTGRGEPEMLRTARMSANLPRMLGVWARLGRTFAPAEEAASVRGLRRQWLRRGAISLIGSRCSPGSRRRKRLLVRLLQLELIEDVLVLGRVIDWSWQNRRSGEISFEFGPGPYR